ncbi:MAG: transposase [Chloroflexota bacterium]
MKNLDYREYYRRSLPHIQPRGATFLMNFRLAGSLPYETIQSLRVEAEQLEARLLLIEDANERAALLHREQRKLFSKWDEALHNTQHRPFYLRDDRVAELVANSIRYHDGEWFDLLAYCIMPNHVHLVLTPYEDATEVYSLTKIMHNIKRNSAKQANRVLGREGTFWQHESYDHFARDEAKLERIIKYVLYNPVKANLVKEQRDWKWSYCKYDF